MKNLFWGILAVALIVSFPLFAAGSPYSTGMKDIKESIAQESNLTVEQVNDLKTNQNYGYGEILILAELAKDSNQPIDTIMSDRSSGMGWGEIAKKYNLKLGEVISNCNKSLNAVEKQFKNNSEVKQARNEIRNAERGKGMMKGEKMERRMEQKEMKMEQKHESMMKEHMGQEQMMQGKGNK